MRFGKGRFEQAGFGGDVRDAALRDPVRHRQAANPDRPALRDARRRRRAGDEGGAGLPEHGRQTCFQGRRGCERERLVAPGELDSTNRRNRAMASCSSGPDAMIRQRSSSRMSRPTIPSTLLALALRPVRSLMRETSEASVRVTSSSARRPRVHPVRKRTREGVVLCHRRFRPLSGQREDRLWVPDCRLNRHFDASNACEPLGQLPPPAPT